MVQDISEGINCLANLRKIAKANESPPPECMAELDDMERAFEGVRQSVRDGVAETNLVVDDSLMADVRGVLGLVADWLKSGQVPADLVPLIETTLSRIGITTEFLDSAS